jgi:hypothetical protein
MLFPPSRLAKILHQIPVHVLMIPDFGPLSLTLLRF